MDTFRFTRRGSEQLKLSYLRETMSPNFKSDSGPRRLGVGLELMLLRHYGSFHSTILLPLFTGK